MTLPPAMYNGRAIVTPGEPTAVVETWSRRRLPFEPRGQQIILRRDMRAAVRDLALPPDSCLHATYTSPAKDRCDVENVLFYNVGLAAFARAMANGVRFERAIGEIPSPPPSLAGDGTPYMHHYRYAVAPAEGPWAIWQTDMTLAMWAVPLDPGDLASCATVWRAMKQGQIRLLARRTSDTEPFGLRLWLDVPEGCTLRLHTLLKPLLDGVISALHQYEGTPPPEVCRHLAAPPHIDAAMIQTWLTADMSAVLGPRAGLVRPFRAGVQWNPQDDLCYAADIRITRTTGPLRLRGEIVTLRRNAEH